MKTRRRTTIVNALSVARKLNNTMTAGAVRRATGALILTIRRKTMMTEDCRKRAEASIERKEAGIKLLVDHCIMFDSRNGGQHLIVEGWDCFIDYWPSTGRWRSRFGVGGWSAAALVVYIKGGIK
jgi:hypothetical protein